jgi:transposase
MEKHRKSGKFPDEVRERAVRLVRVSEVRHASQCAALVSVLGRIGCTAETLDAGFGRPRSMAACGAA